MGNRQFSNFRLKTYCKIQSVLDNHVSVKTWLKKCLISAQWKDFVCSEWGKLNSSRQERATTIGNELTNNYTGYSWTLFLIGEGMKTGKTNSRQNKDWFVKINRKGEKQQYKRESKDPKVGEWLDKDGYDLFVWPQVPKSPSLTHVTNEVIEKAQDIIESIQSLNVGKAKIVDTVIEKLDDKKVKWMLVFAGHLSFTTAITSSSTAQTKVEGGKKQWIYILLG